MTPGPSEYQTESKKSYVDQQGSYVFKSKESIER